MIKTLMLSLMLVLGFTFSSFAGVVEDEGTTGAQRGSTNPGDDPADGMNRGPSTTATVSEKGHGCKECYSRLNHSRLVAPTNPKSKSKDAAPGQSSEDGRR